MRKFIIITILTFSLLSCKEQIKRDSNLLNTNIENLTPGPIVHESLNEEQLDKIKFIQKIFKEVYPVSLEETITNFKRDQNPDNEINIWMNMAKTFQYFASENSEKKSLTLEKRLLSYY